MLGKTLAHYEITSLLGKGGMGDVYRARDTRLDREIALKVLPADVATDPGRLDRFESVWIATSNVDVLAPDSQVLAVDSRQHDYSLAITRSIDCRLDRPIRHGHDEPFPDREGTGSLSRSRVKSNRYIIVL